MLIGLSAVAQQPLPGSAPAQPGTSEKVVKLYPNPAISYITFEVKSEAGKGLSLQVFSAMLGKKMYETRFPGERFTLNLNEYFRGLYFYYLVDANGRVIESGKFNVSK